MWKTNHIVKLDVRNAYKGMFNNLHLQEIEKPNPSAQAQENQTYEKKYLSSRRK